MLCIRVRVIKWVQTRTGTEMFRACEEFNVHSSFKCEENWILNQKELCIKKNCIKRNLVWKQILHENKFCMKRNFAWKEIFYEKKFCMQRNFAWKESLYQTHGAGHEHETFSDLHNLIIPFSTLIRTARGSFLAPKIVSKQISYENKFWLT